MDKLGEKGIMRISDGRAFRLSTWPGIQSARWSTHRPRPGRLFPGKGLYFRRSLICLCWTTSRPRETPPLNKLLFTIFDGEGVSACGEVGIDDPVEFVEIAAGGGSEPHEPRLFGDVECHLVVGCLAVPADVRRPRDSPLAHCDSGWVRSLVNGPAVIGAVFDYLRAKLVVHPGDGPARICWLCGGERRPGEGIGPGVSLLVGKVISAIAVGLR